MKRRYHIRRGSVLLAALVLLMTGCGRMDTAQKEQQTLEEDKIQVVCTTYPQYSFLQAIIGEETDSVDLSLIMDDGTDLHSYQPVAMDLARIASADLLVYIGGESDSWVEDAIAEAVNPDMTVVNLMELTGENAKEEELVEGMQEPHGEEAETEYDEHVWLSLKNAMVFVRALSDEMQKLDEANADAYQKNTENYIGELEALDHQYEEVVAAAPHHTLIFGDRFPFRYLVDDYQLEYYAAFPGCSAETEASFETVTFLAGKIDELGVGGILVLENSDQRVAETIRNNTKTKDQKILVMNSLQSVTKEQIENGASYLEGMRANLEVLEQALY